MIRTLFLAFLVSLGLANPASAQAAAQEAEITPSTRFIDSARLAEKPPLGIREYWAALGAIDVEFAPVKLDLDTRLAELQALDARRQHAVSARRADEAQKLAGEVTAAETDLRRRGDDARDRLDRRTKQLVRPVTLRITEAAKRFSQLRGMPDLRFAEGAGIGPYRRVGAREVTADFVSWYNATVAP